MAKEIMVLGKPDRVSYSFLFLYAIASPIALPGWDGTAETGGGNVVPSPSSTLPEEVAAEFTAAEKAALDAGTAAFEIVRGFKDEGLDDAALLAIVRARYVEAKAAWLSGYAVTYSHFGKRLSA